MLGDENTLFSFKPSGALVQPYAENEKYQFQGYFLEMFLNEEILSEGGDQLIEIQISNTP